MKLAYYFRRRSFSWILLEFFLSFSVFIVFLLSFHTRLDVTSNTLFSIDHLVSINYRVECRWQGKELRIQAKLLFDELIASNLKAKRSSSYANHLSLQRKTENKKENSPKSWRPFTSQPRFSTSFGKVFKICIFFSKSCFFYVFSHFFTNFLIFIQFSLSPVILYYSSLSLHCDSRHSTPSAPSFVYPYSSTLLPLNQPWLFGWPIPPNLNILPHNHAARKWTLNCRDNDNRGPLKYKKLFVTATPSWVYNILSICSVIGWIFCSNSVSNSVFSSYNDFHTKSENQHAFCSGFSIWHNLKCWPSLKLTRKLAAPMISGETLIAYILITLFWRLLARKLWKLSIIFVDVLWIFTFF